MERWQETVGFCLCTTGLGGAFSCGVVSEVCRVLKLISLTVFILQNEDLSVRLIGPRLSRKGCFVKFQNSPLTFTI